MSISDRFQSLNYTGDKARRDLIAGLAWFAVNQRRPDPPPAEAGDPPPDGAETAAGRAPKSTAEK